jgi:hypothetical protein
MYLHSFFSDFSAPRHFLISIMVATKYALGLLPSLCF